jgi:lantibiotic biosynthesis protein
MTGTHPAAGMPQAIAGLLADPGHVPGGTASRPWWRQSLAHGAPGIALLHVEVAAAGGASWQPARDWLTAITAGPVTGGPDCYPFYGAPAIAHVLARAADCLPAAGLKQALDILDRHIAAGALTRVAAAHARISSGALPVLAEFDAVRGLAGTGAYLLRRDPVGTVTLAVLGYLVRLTDPVTSGGGTLPGWWTLTGPSGQHSARFPGGHGNLGLAHGITVISCVKSFSQVEVMFIVKSR